VRQLNVRGVALMQQDALKAQRLIMEAHELAETAGSDSLLMDTERNLGLVLFYQGDYELAAQWFRRSLQRAMSLADTLLMIRLNGKIGMSLAAQSKYDEAELHYDDAMELLQNRLHFDPKVLVNTAVSLAAVKRRNGKFQESEALLNQALKTSQQYAFDEGIAQALSNLGSLYLQQKDYKRADSLLTRSLVYSERAGSGEGVVRNYLMLGDLYIQSGNCMGAEQVLKKGLKMSETLYLRPQKAENLRLLWKASECRGDFNQAFIWQNQYLLVRDSLDMESKQRTIRSLETYYQMDAEAGKKAFEKKVATLEKKVGRYRLFTWVFAGAFFVTLFVAVWSGWKLRRIRQVVRS
jgi:tetratricopeptide (TPR) repeat protein